MAEAMTILAAMLVGEVKTVWSCISEGFDFAGDTAMFLAIKADTESPIQNIRAHVTPVVIPACISFSASAFLSAIPFPVRGCGLQLRQRRRDVSELGMTETYKFAAAHEEDRGWRAQNQDGQAPPAHTPTQLAAGPGAHTHARACADTHIQTHKHTRTRTHTFLRAHMHADTQIPKRTCTRTHTRMHTRTHTHTHTYTQTHTHTHTHTHTRTHTRTCTRARERAHTGRTGANVTEAAHVAQAALGL